MDPVTATMITTLFTAFVGLLSAALPGLLKLAGDAIEPDNDDDDTTANAADDALEVVPRRSAPPVTPKEQRQLAGTAGIVLAVSLAVAAIVYTTQRGK